MTGRKFVVPEATYQDRDLCVTGQIKAYRGAPEIVASDRSRSKNSVSRQSTT
jgi:hypothetical protein